jgi:hypothetical protein
MGHYYPQGLTKITMNTDYAIRKPTYGRKATIDGYNDIFTDVYIESDERLLESLPNYPKYLPNPKDGIESSYFSNITPQIQKTLNSFFTNRGYNGVIVTEISKDWQPPLSEMKIGDIVKKMHGIVDILCVFHYMDVGSFKGSIRTDVLGSGASANYPSGLVRLDYSLSIFDATSGEQVLSSDVRYLAVMYKIYHDPKILNDPRYKDRINVQEYKIDSYETGTYQNSLTSDEIIEIAMKYLQEDLKDLP